MFELCWNIIFIVVLFEDFLVKVLTLFYETRDKFWIRRNHSVSMHEAILFKISPSVEQYGSSFWIQQIQYQGDLSFWSFLYVYVFNLLQAIRTHLSHISHCTTLWFFAIALLHFKHGNWLPCIRISKCYAC